jgi:hypothetical protein
MSREHLASMALVVALIAFAIGTLASWATFRRAKANLRRGGRDRNPSVEDWRTADPFGGRWAPPAFTVAFIAAIVGIYGFGVPTWVRAALIGALAGFCLPPFVHGVILRFTYRQR